MTTSSSRFASGPGISRNAAKLGMTVNGDPLTAGVASFDCGSDCRRLTGIMPKAGVTVAAY